MKPPKWKDTEKTVAIEAQTQWVREIREWVEEYEFANRRWDTHPGIPMSEITGNMEREAIAAAEDGDFKPLANMIVNPLFKHTPLVLGPKARSLIAAKLNGTFRRRSGAPKQTLEQRELKTVHWAAKEVDPITTLLKQHYPNETGHRDRAISIAAKQFGISRQDVETELGSRHNKRPKKRSKKRSRKKRVK